MKLYYIQILILSVLFFSFYTPAKPDTPGSTLSFKSDSSSVNKENNIIHGNFNLNPAGDKPPPTDDALTKAIYHNINISGNSLPQNEPSVKISRKNPDRVVAAWRDFRMGAEPPNRKIGYSYSTDGGTTWQPSEVLLSFNPFYKWSSDPVVTVDTSGYFYISVISINEKKSNSIVCVYKSTNEGETFDDIYYVSPHPDSVDFGDDKSFITCDMVNGSPYLNTLYIFWSSDSESVISKSTNSGQNWSERNNIIPDGSGYALAPAIGPNGDIFLVWLGMLKGNKYGLYISRSINGGQSFSSKFICPVAYNSSYTRFPSIAVDLSGGKRNGYVYIVWSNESTSTGDEMIFLSSSSDKGETWSEPKRINQDSLHTQRKQYWPSVTVNGYGNVYITYYDTRNTGSTNIINTYLARSANGGHTFQNLLLSTAHTHIEYQNTDIRFGDYISIDSWKSKVIPVWTDERKDGYDMEIYSSVITDSTVGITSVTNDIPPHYSLYQSSPSLFDIQGDSKFELPLPTSGSTSIYNLFGSEVSLIENEKRQEENIKTKLDALNFKNGIYLNRMNFGIFIQTGKLLLVK